MKGKTILIALLVALGAWWWTKQLASGGNGGNGGSGGGGGNNTLKFVRGDVISTHGYLYLIIDVNLTTQQYHLVSYLHQTNDVGWQDAYLWEDAVLYSHVNT